MLRMDHLTAAPWGESLLEDISLSVAAGEIHGIIGPNGAGKSSLLNCIAGDLSLQSGELDLNGRPLQQWSRRELACHMAVLPQRSLLNFPFRVDQVVAMGRIPHDSGADRDLEITGEVVSAMDIVHLQQRLYTQLSGGEQQRVQLARILAQIWDCGPADAGLLLLDEPTSALDLAHQQLLLELLRQLAGRGLAIIMVVHDFNLLASSAHRISALKKGRIVAQGSPGEVINEQLFLDVFGVEVSLSPHPLSGLPMVLPR